MENVGVTGERAANCRALARIVKEHLAAPLGKDLERRLEQYVKGIEKHQVSVLKKP